MRFVFINISMILIIMFGAFNGKSQNSSKAGFIKNIKFNHLFVVIDDSTYKYLFDSLKLPKNFAGISEQTTDAGSASWTGKYLFGISNYLEFFKPGGIKESRLGDFGLGFTTNKFGTIDSLQNYWATTLDSVHVENTTTSDNGKTAPWFTSVSIPNIDSLKVSAWVFENSKEEMHFAGFSDYNLLGEIEYTDYNKHISAKLRNVPLDSIKNNKVLDRITSLNISLSGKELSYLKHFLLDVGFTQKNCSFSKDDFIITYSLNNQEHFLLKEIGFSLLKKMPEEKYSFRKIDIVVDGSKATMKFKYD